MRATQVLKAASWGLSYLLLLALKEKTGKNNQQIMQI